MSSQLLQVPQRLFVIVLDVQLKIPSTILRPPILGINEVLPMAGAAEAPVQSDPSLGLLA